MSAASTRRAGRALLAACVLAGCAAKPPPGDGLRISHFRQGLMDPNDRQYPRIYQPGSAFAYEVNGTCRVGGGVQPCMGHGIEFSFESPEEVTELDCTATKSGNWTLTLRGRTGAKRHFQYAIPPEGAAVSAKTEYRCRYRGREVLRYDFTIGPAAAR